MGKRFVSVLIDTYNHERFIEQAIISVLEQDFPPSEREIIVVDDGSTDRTPDIIRKFEPRVRLLRKENGGQASAFNAGIPECLGEIVAFLDGDDWWAPGKLQAVSGVLAGDASIGLVGHGITEVFPDGSEHSHLLNDKPRFRIDSPGGAHTFRLRKSFLGTSRMTLRSSILRQINVVPESLRIEADEYLFTLAAFFSDVSILRESLTFYRLHAGNAFQIANGNKIAVRQKQRVLEALAESLKTRLQTVRAEEQISRIVLEAIETEAALIRLSLDPRFPWETIPAELRNYRIMHPDATILHTILKWLSLLPSCVMSSRSYYSWREKFARNHSYQWAREKWLPFLKHRHVDRSWSAKP